MCLLKKSQYGLKQAGRSWYVKLSDTMRKYGAKPTGSDPCVFQIGSGKRAIFIAVYVDDILVASRNQDDANALGGALALEFEVKDLGLAEYCLGIEFQQEALRSR